MQPITTSQMRKIYAAAREHGLDNDLLHIHLQTVTGKESLKELTMSEAIKLIDSLEGKKGRTGSMQMTEKQFRYINMLMKDLGWMKTEKEIINDSMGSAVKDMVLTITAGSLRQWLPRS